VCEILSLKARMTERNSTVPLSPQLQPGQFYGQVINKRFCSGLVLSELTHRTGRRLPEHSHQLAYFCLLLAGNYFEYRGRSAVSYKPLTVVFHPPEFAHRDEVGTFGGHFFSVEMEKPWMERLREYSPVPDTIMSTQTGDLSWLAMRLYREFRQPDACSPLAVEGLVMAMLTDVTRGHVKEEKQIPDWLNLAVDLIHEEFRQNLTINGVADEVGVHPFHLSKVFRQFRKQSIGKFVNGLRVQFACQELSVFERRLADIALDAGFADQSHFTRVFKHLTGMTPGAFREAVRGSRPRR
jgi:AraC family transcriptional regulator